VPNEGIFRVDAVDVSDYSGYQRYQQSSGGSSRKLVPFAKGVVNHEGLLVVDLAGGSSARDLNLRTPLLRRENGTQEFLLGDKGNRWAFKVPLWSLIVTILHYSISAK